MLMTLPIHIHKIAVECRRQILTSDRVKTLNSKLGISVGEAVTSISYCQNVYLYTGQCHLKLKFNIYI